MTEIVPEKQPINVDMADLINVIFMNPLDAVVKGIADDDEEAIQRQIRPATPEEMADIESLAQRAALLQDEIKGLLGNKPRELAALKEQLLERMLNHGLPEVYVPGRPAIEVVVRNERKGSKKSLIAARTKELAGDKAKATEEITRLWNAIPQVPKESLSIPDPTPPEIDSPY